ncbi:MAG: hypothetical protein ACE5NG_09765 [bacterium]
MVEASGERAYPELAQIYKRLLVLVTIDEERPSVVDVFHVKGGSMHDWLMHGSANLDQRATCSLKLIPKSGTMLEKDEKFVEPHDCYSSFNPYGLMKNVQAGRSLDRWNVTFLSGMARCCC